MMPSAPHSMTMGTGEGRIADGGLQARRPLSIGPSGVAFPSNRRTRAPISPPAVRKAVASVSGDGEDSRTLP